MICAECPNLIEENGIYKCTYMVDEHNAQKLSPHYLAVKVEMKSKPRLCNVNKKGAQK